VTVICTLKVDVAVAACEALANGRRNSAAAAILSVRRPTIDVTDIMTPEMTAQTWCMQPELIAHQNLKSA
jgi:hypothetical protein